MSPRPLPPTTDSLSHETTQLSATESPFPVVIISLGSGLGVLLVICGVLIFFICKLKRGQRNLQEQEDKQEIYEPVETPKKPRHANTLTRAKLKNLFSRKSKQALVVSPRSSQNESVASSIELQSAPPPRPPKLHSSPEAIKYPGTEASTTQGDTVNKREVDSSVTGNDRSKGVDNPAHTQYESTDEVISSSEEYEKLNRSDKTINHSDDQATDDENDEKPRVKNDEGISDTDRLSSVLNDGSSTSLDDSNADEAIEGNGISEQPGEGFEIYDVVKKTFEALKTK